MKKSLKELLFIFLGTALFSLSVAWIASPSGLVTGGVSGVGVIIKALSFGKVPIYVTSFLLNLPLFAIALFQRGARFISKSVFAFLSLTVTLGIFEAYPTPDILENDLLLSALIYGGLSGIGLGLVLRSSATSGGSDMLASIIKFKKPHLKISRLILIIDVLIIALGVFVFGLRASVYAIFALIISAKAIDLVLTGAMSARAVFIVSDKALDISLAVFKELERGVTSLDAIGMYTNKKRTLLFTVISSREVARLQSIISEIDERAFMTVVSAREVLGEGFESIIKNKNSLV